VAVTDVTSADIDEPGRASQGRPVLPLMRVLLVVGTVLVFAAGTQLYVLSADTARYFAGIWPGQVFPAFSSSSG
jgi:hypothetical protein